MTILKADNKYKRNAYIFMAVIIVVGFILVQWGLPAFGKFINNQKPEDAIQIVLVIVFLMFFLPFLLSIFVFRKGRQVLAAGQFPLPGAKVIQDTKVLEGKLARRRAYALIGLSIFLGAGCLFGSVYFPYSFHKMLHCKSLTPKSNNGVQTGSVSLRSPPPLRP